MGMAPLSYPSPWTWRERRDLRGGGGMSGTLRLPQTHHIVMPREGGASSTHQSQFCLKDLWLLDRPLSRTMTSDRLLPMSLASHRQQILVLAGEHQIAALVVQGRGHDHDAGRALGL